VPARAAEELRVAQPSLSRTIARLEGELGTPLFDRSGRLRLNDAGKLFLGYVERSLGELDAGRRAVAEAISEGVGTVRLASETFLTLTGPLAAYKRAHPDIEVELRWMPAEEMARHLRAQEGARKGHWQRRLLDRPFAARSLTPKIVCEVDEPSAIADLIGAGLGIGLVPAFARRSSTRVTAAWVAVDSPDCRRTVTLYWAADSHLSTAARLMRTTITSWNWITAEPRSNADDDVDDVMRDPLADAGLPVGSVRPAGRSES
jgi:DNA-binding transcriptional LysR family regulator